LIYHINKFTRAVSRMKYAGGQINRERDTDKQERLIVRLFCAP